MLLEPGEIMLDDIMSAYKISILYKFEKTGYILFMKNSLIMTYTTDIFYGFSLRVEFDIKKEDPFHGRLKGKGVSEGCRY